MSGGGAGTAARAARRAVLFEDGPGRSTPRGTPRGRPMGARLGHSAGPEEGPEGRVPAARSPREDGPGGVPSGGLWSVAADGRAGAEAPVRGDPFRAGGPRRSVRILHRPRFSDRAAVV